LRWKLWMARVVFSAMKPRPVERVLGQMVERAQEALHGGDVAAPILEAVADGAGERRRRIEQQAGALGLLEQPVVDRALGRAVGVGIAVDFEPVLFLIPFERADHGFGRVALGFAGIFGRRCVGLDASERVVERRNIGGIIGLAIAGRCAQRKEIEFVKHVVFGFGGG